MKTKLAQVLTGALAPVFFLITSPPASAGLADGEVGLTLRYRYEWVDQQNFSEDAKASTLRARLNYQSGEASGFSFFVELEAIAEIGADDFDAGAGNTGPDRAQFPVVADPEGEEVNQAYLQFKAGDETRLRLGRQRINLDNQRFVGGVGWRQNEQTYDALNVVNESIANTRIEYAYVANVNRIFGDDVPAGDHDSETHLLNVRRNLEGVGQLSGYYYGIDNEDAPGFSTDTFGLRFVGNTKLSDRAFSYTLEAAYQEDAGNNPIDYDELYYRLDAALDLSPVKLSAGYEVLGGNADRGGAAFRTPLATLHAFNGWADQFLATPDAGLEDLFLGVSGKLGQWSWQAIYHDFQAEDSGNGFGQEIDLSLATKFAKRYGLLLKFADFDADGPGFVDVTKAWLMFSAEF